MKPKHKISTALFAPAWFATIALVCSCDANAQTSPFVGDVTVSGNTIGNGWGLFKQGVRMGTASEALMTWFPGTFPAGTALFDIAWADGTFTWRDTYVGATASNKMSLDAANNLMLYNAAGTVAITLAPESGKITLPAGTGTSTGSGIYFGISPDATLAASATGAAIFPSQVTLQNGLSVSSGNMNIASSTASINSNTGALTVAGGLGVGGAIHANTDSFINGVRIGKGSGNQSTNTALGSNVLSSNSSGEYNTGTGGSSLRNNTWGTRNVAVGSNSLFSNTYGGYNSAVGVSSLSGNISGSYNSALGFQSLVANTTGELNSSLGNKAGQFNTTGTQNVFLGSSAGSYQASGSALTDPENSIYIGANSRGLNNLDDNSIVIGTNAVSAGPNSVVIGNSATLTTRLFGTVNAATISASYISAYSMTPYSLAVSSSSMTVGGYPVLTSTNATNSIGLSGGNATNGGTAMSYGTANASGATAMSGGIASNYVSTAVSNGRASGLSSFAAGNFATAGSYSSTALGSYNSSFGGNYSWIETDPILMVGNGTAPNLTSNALVTLKNGNTTLTNKAWKAANPSATPNAPTALVDPDTTIDTDSGGNALVVDGHTVLNGKVTISVPQGDISMGIYQ